MMVELMNPKADDVICDPSCGTAGFLVEAGEYLWANKKNEIFYDKQKKDHFMNHMFYGYDMDRTMLRIGAMNMMNHRVESPFIEYRDSLSDQNTDKDKYSLILANPPFKGSLDADIVSADLLKVCKTKKTELLFLALFVRMLKVGGRCAASFLTEYYLVLQRHIRISEKKLWKIKDSKQLSQCHQECSNHMREYRQLS